MKIIEAYKCEKCGEVHSREDDAYRCEFKHTQLNYANCLLEMGHALGYINRQCGFGWNLTPEQERVTKDNCFIVSHWQCCEKPAYKIVHIESDSYVKLWGRGSWNGYYGDNVRPEKLTTPYAPEELFIDPRK